MHHYRILPIILLTFALTGCIPASDRTISLDNPTEDTDVSSASDAALEDTATAQEDTASPSITDTPSDTFEAMTDTSVAPSDSGEPDGSTVMDTMEDVEPSLPCHPDFGVDPNPAYAESSTEIAFTADEGFTYISLALEGPSAPTKDFVGVVRPDARFQWVWDVTGMAPGVWSASFSHTVDDPEGQPDVLLGTCAFRVLPGSNPNPDPDPEPDAGMGPCTPSCVGVICGGDDGCGGSCAGGRRGELGASSDCRGNGDCGCGLRGQADNMSCTGEGKCLVRCECDCLPGGASALEPGDVVGMDFSASCSLALERSGDPTIWDYTRNVPLCPTGDLPDGMPDSFYCEACPACHRGEPPACAQELYCACVDPGYRSTYPRYNQICQ